MPKDSPERHKGLFGLIIRIYGRVMRCPRGQHYRSRKLVRKRGEQHISRCYCCGAPMVRLAKRNWVVDTKRT